MKILESINLLKKEKQKLFHLIVSLNYEDHKLSIKNKLIESLKNIIEIKNRLDIPITTINISTLKEEEIIEVLSYFSENCNNSRFLVIGDWYNKNTKIDSLSKDLINNTVNYNKSYINILINYDIKKELISSIRLIIKKILLKKIKFKEISEEIFKENIFSSNFLNPNLIIETGKKPRFSGTFITEIKDVCIYYTKDSYYNITLQELEKAIEFADF